MRSFKSGLLALAISGLFTTAAFVGCSADGGSTITPEQDPTDPGPGAVLPPPSGGDDDDDVDSDSGKKDAGKADSGKKDATVDAGPPPPVPGTACTVDSETRDRACGACGKQKTVCLDEGTGKKWTEYGACENEIAGGCVPGTTVDEECGNCGTVKKTCTAFCAYTSGTCTGQPVGNCKKGTVEYITAGCPTAGTYRTRTCADTCTWGSTTTTCDTPTTSNQMTIANGVGGTVSATWSLTGTTKRPSSCPGTVSATSSAAPYAVVEVTNPSATKTAEVTIYQSQSSTGKANIDMVLWTYAGNALPMTDTALGACTKGIEDYCMGSGTPIADAPCGNTGSNFYFAGFAGATIPPGGKILVYSAAYTSTTVLGDGTFNLNIKTDKLQ